MTDLKRTPLHPFHAAHGARFVPFGGWEMPVQYTSILEEHRAVREAAGLFDVSHMGEFLVEGPEAATFLDRLLVNKIASCPVGKAVYSPMCQPDGGTVDDLIAYRTGDDAFLLCVNASNREKDWSWCNERLVESDPDARLKDASDEFSLLAIQGPLAAEILTAAGFSGAAELKRFRHEVFPFEGGEVRICRTGYTGEDGFEIYSPPEVAPILAETLLKEGEPKGLKLCGLGARDSLRLEAGFPLYGHELSETISPLEAGLEWTVKFDKPDFVGREALLKQRDGGPCRSLVHFKLEGRRIAREGAEVLDSAGALAGRVLSGTLSPISNCPIGSALLESGQTATDLHVELRGTRVPMEIEEPPLHKK